MMAPSALLITRDSFLTEYVKGITDSIGQIQLETCGSLAEAQLQLSRPNTFLLLFHLPADNPAEIMRFLRHASSQASRCRSIVLCDVYRTEEAAALLHAGASDYLRYPYDWGKLATQVENFARDALSTSPSALTPVDSAAAPCNSRDLVLDAEMSAMMELIRRAAPQETTLLFSGETGTGKTHLARLVHQLSPRRDEPFLVLDCAALSATLIESEMFGHVRGAFTGADRDRPGRLAAAGRGTLLLDEVNALPLALQSKLLRAVDERLFEPVGSNKTTRLEARLIAISNTLLEHDVIAGRFRADLYYRLNVVSFYLPPLRERRSTIVPLAEKFLSEYAARNRPDIRAATSDALHVLEGYDWPGNIRELRNVIERAVALSVGPEIRMEDLPEAIRGTTPRFPAAMAVEQPPCSLPFSLSQTRERVEVHQIREALKKHRNNRLRAAAELGISRMGLYKKLRKYGLMITG